jgi:hypothetical protein
MFFNHEYVPTVDEARVSEADLVSIALNVSNHGDAHFRRGRRRPCDTNDTGVHRPSESGADGKKLNDHLTARHLQLRRQGHGRGGPIKRGDPITSSRHPGYGAYPTCKIIGTHSKMRTGKTRSRSLPITACIPIRRAALRAQVDELQRRTRAGRV